MELGLDLSNTGFWKQNSQHILESNETLFGRITTEPLTGVYRKYAYLSSLNSEYILEIGLISSEFTNVSSDINFLVITSELEQINPFVETVRILDSRGYVRGNFEFKPTSEFQEFIYQIFTSQQNLEITNYTTNT